MGTSEIIASALKMMVNMESFHKLILGICIMVCITIIILVKRYLSSRASLKRYQMLIEAAQSTGQHTQINIFLLSHTDYKDEL